MTPRAIPVISAALFVISLCTAAYTIFDFWWLGSSVVAMSEDLERYGIIDAVRAAELRDAEPTPYASTGEYLMQRHERSVAIGLYLLSGIATLGFGTLAMMSYNVQPFPTYAHGSSRQV